MCSTVYTTLVFIGRLRVVLCCGVTLLTTTALLFRALRTFMSGRTTSYFYDEDGVTLMKRVFHKGRLEPVIVFPWAADITHLLLGLMLDSLDADNMRLGRN